MNDQPCRLAVEASEAAKSAHQRLNAINGQIAGLRTAQERANELAQERDAKRDEQHTRLSVGLAEVKTRTSMYAALAAFVATAIAAPIAVWVIVAVLHLGGSHQNAPTATNGSSVYHVASGPASR